MMNDDDKYSRVMIAGAHRPYIRYYHSTTGTYRYSTAVESTLMGTIRPWRGSLQSVSLINNQHIMDMIVSYVNKKQTLQAIDVTGCDRIPQSYRTKHVAPFTSLLSGAH